MNKKYSVKLSEEETAETFYFSGNKAVDCTSDIIGKPQIDEEKFLGILHKGFESRPERDQMFREEIRKYKEGEGMLKEVSNENLYITPSFQFNRMKINDERQIWQ